MKSVNRGRISKKWEHWVKSALGNFGENVLSKMTYANLSQATAASQKFYHRSQNTFNQIQNSLMTIEIHDQGKPACNI